MRVKWFIHFLIIFSFIVMGLNSGFCSQLVDKKLIINGTIQQELLWHVGTSFIPYGVGYDTTHFRTSLKLEGTWHAIKTSQHQLDVRIVLKNFYDAALDIDADYKRSMRLYSTKRAQHDLRYYDTFRNICRELFLNFVKDTYQIRIGKQIVNWGETSAVRMVDIVNPVDLLGLADQAFLTNFYDIKRGLWMVRLLVTPLYQPLDMTYEFIVVPDFQPDLVPPWGSYPPLGIMQPFDMFKPFAQGAIDSLYPDRPKSWSDVQLGFRVRGFVWGFDWTFLYYYHRVSTPIFDGNRGYKNYTAAYEGRRVSRAWSYPFIHTFGLTFNKPFTFKIPLLITWLDGNILHFEGVFDYHRSFNRFIGPDPFSQRASRKRLNRYGLAIGWDAKMYIPWLTPRNNNNYLKTKFQIFQNWIQNRRESDEWGQTGMIKQFFGIPPSRRSSTKITVELSYDFLKTRLMPYLYWSHNLTNGEGLYVPALSILPFNNWMFLISYTNFYNSVMKNTDYMSFGIQRDF